MEARFEFYSFETSNRNHWKQKYLGSDFKDEKKIKYQLFHTSLRRFVHTGLFLLLNELDLYCQKIMTEYILF